MGTTIDKSVVSEAAARLRRWEQAACAETPVLAAGAAAYGAHVRRVLSKARRHPRLRRIIAG